MTMLKMAFDIFARSTRPMSATDLQVRLPIYTENPRRLTCELRRQGCIEEAFRLGGEKFFRAVPSANAPVDRRTENDPSRARQVRNMKIREARRGGR